MNSFIRSVSTGDRVVALVHHDDETETWSLFGTVTRVTPEDRGMIRVMWDGTDNEQFAEIENLRVHNSESRKTVDLLFRETGTRRTDVPVYRDYGDIVEVLIKGNIIEASRTKVSGRYQRAVIVERG